jgi:hypothetical protein
VGKISSRDKAKETGREDQTGVVLSRPTVLLLATNKGQKNGLRTECIRFASPRALVGHAWEKVVWDERDSAGVRIRGSVVKRGR